MLDTYDDLIAALARRVLTPRAPGPAERVALRLELVDALSALFEAQQRGAPASCLAPLLPGAVMGGGARVPGSSLELEPPQAAYCIAWLAGDARVGALLPLGDWLARRAILAGEKPPRVALLLEAALQVRELAEALRLPLPSAELPLAAPLTTRIAVAGVAMRLMGGSVDEIAAALSLAFADGIAPHDGETARACAAAASGGVRAALLVRAGAPPVPHVLTSRPAGFQAALLGGATITLAEPPPPALPSFATDELSTWHRFELAVRGHFKEKQALRLLAALNATAPFEELALQSFVAQLVRAS